MDETHKTPRAKYHAPYWIKDVPNTVFPAHIKDFYGYLCAFGPDSCWLWNCRLQQKFGVSRRTIQLWLSWLRNHNLIWISKPFGPERKIHPRYHGSPAKWLTSIVCSKATKTVKKAQHRAQDIENKKQQQIRALLWNSGGTQGRNFLRPTV